MRISKDPERLRETNSALDQRKKPYTDLKDYSLLHHVRMEWDISKEAERERMFILKVDDLEVVLDWEEVLKAGRFI